MPQPASSAASSKGRCHDRKDERQQRPGRPVIVFDVNETLLDLDALRPTFDRIFNDPAAMRLWFADLILYSDQLIERYPAVANVS